MLPLLLLTLPVHALPQSGDPPTAWIVNGEVEEGFPAVVSLGVSAGEWSFSMCTGSVITPRVVLTAAHCGADFPLELVVEIGDAIFGTDIMAPDHVLGFEDMAIHPDYEPLVSGPVATDLGENDVAVLILAEDAPVPPLRLYTGTLSEDDLGRALKSVGYGLTGQSASDGSGVKHSVDLVLDELTDMYVVAEASSAPTNGTICSGDSGGPQLMQLEEGGQWHQVAVHSWGDNGCATTGGSTRVDVTLDWILERVQAQHGTDDLCEINGNYDDGVCDTWCQGEDPDCVVVEPAELKGCAAVPAGAGLAGLALALLGLRRRGR